MIRPLKIPLLTKGDFLKFSFCQKDFKNPSFSNGDFRDHNPPSSEGGLRGMTTA